MGMKRYLLAVLALCFVMAAALTGCSHTDRCGANFCVCEPGDEGIREMGLSSAPGARSTADVESDLIEFDALPESIDEQPELADAPAEDEAIEPEEEDFSGEAMARTIREIEENSKDEAERIQAIIDDGYADVPSVHYEAPAVALADEAETAPDDFAADVPEFADVAEAAAEEAAVAAVLDVAEAEPKPEAVEEPEEVEVEIVAVAEGLEEAAPLEEMAADFQQYMDIEAYDAGEPAAGELIAEEPEAPAVAEEEVVAVLPPPLYGTPEPAAYDDEPELSLEGFDDMDLEFFGDISESLLEADS
jgi:hypothetical protein